MNEALVYDAKTKKRILGALLEHLYLPVESDLRLRLNKLIVKNSLLLENNQRAVIYKNEVYAMDDNTVLPRVVNKLDRSLEDEMKQILKERQTIDEDELPYVKAYLVKILNTTNHFPDYYELLPHALHNVLDKLKLSCPCRSSYLDKRGLDNLRDKNVVPVELMKQRMTYNLLLK